MPALDITEEQLVHLFSQLTLEQKKHILKKIIPLRENISNNNYNKPVFGSMKDKITYISPDFDAPLEDFKDYA